MTRNYTEGGEDLQQRQGGEGGTGGRIESKTISWRSTPRHPALTLPIFQRESCALLLLSTSSLGRRTRFFIGMT